MAATLVGQAKRAVRVAVVTPTLLLVVVRRVRVTTAVTARLLVVVAVATPKQVALILLVRVATVLCTGGSRRPLLAMRAVAVQATTTRV